LVISNIAMSTYMTARARNVPWVALGAAGAGSGSGSGCGIALALSNLSPTTAKSKEVDLVSILI
jgi:hypothetical protein